MKQITLQNMKIRNFKGFKEFNLEADGKNMRIYGDNATGKTSLYDAFLWALFGKDSTGASDFAWKPLDEDNQPVHHLETEVELILNIEDIKLKLNRMIEEKWTRKRGSDTKTFDKHETTYRINGIKTTQAKYKKHIEEIISEETFKQLTNVYYVAETLHHKKRRELLFSLVEPLTDAEVIDSKEGLKPLHEILDGRSVDDKRTLIKEEKSSVNKDLDRVPDRIDEVDRSIPDLSKLNKKELENTLNRLESEINSQERRIASVQNGDGIVQLNSELNKKKSELEVLKNQYEAGRSFYVEDLNKERDKIYLNLNAAADTHIEEVEQSDKLERKIANDQKRIDLIDQEMNQKRDEFKIIRNDSFPDFDEHKTVCSVCGQDYSPEKQMEIKEKYESERSAFNQNKASKLEKNQKEGKALANEKGVLESAIEQNKEALSKQTKVLKQSETRKEELQEKYNDIKSQIDEKLNSRKPFEETLDYLNKQEEITELLASIDEHEHSIDKQVETEKQKLAEIKQQRSQIEDSLYQFKLVEKQEARKQELINEEKKLSERYGELEDQLYLIDEFVRTKVSMLTDRINENFEIVEFKLFEEQLNGGLKEICEPIVKGVPFSGGLNNAARINAGLDIVSTLGKIERVSAPIFIDNSESITKILETEAQQIQLIVKKGVNELEAEVEEDTWQMS